MTQKLASVSYSVAVTYSVAYSVACVLVLELLKTTEYDRPNRQEGFSTKCSKTKTKVINLANHNRPKHHNEPIRTRFHVESSTDSE